MATFGTRGTGNPSGIPLEQAPIAPLYFNAQTYLIHPAVKNWHPSPLGFQRFQKVWLEN